MLIAAFVHAKTLHLIDDHQARYNCLNNQIYPLHKVASLKELGFTSSQSSPARELCALKVQSSRHGYLTLSVKRLIATVRRSSVASKVVPLTTSVHMCTSSHTSGSSSISITVMLSQFRPIYWAWLDGPRDTQLKLPAFDVCLAIYSF